MSSCNSYQHRVDGRWQQKGVAINWVVFKITTSLAIVRKVMGVIGSNELIYNIILLMIILLLL
jgi:hypothetical protein